MRRVADIQPAYMLPGQAQLLGVSAPVQPQHAYPNSQPLSTAQLGYLLLLAVSRPDLAWPAGRDVADARNAHVTNNVPELSAALEENYDYLEGDVRVGRDGEPVMAHDPGAEGSMRLVDWLEVVRRSGRGIKLDFKESKALWRSAALVRQAHIPDSRLIFNITISGEPEANITLASAKALRKMFPKAIINLSVGDPTYNETVMHRMQMAAKAVGGPIMFPLRIDLVDKHVVQQLRPFGKIAIWNFPGVYSPKSIAADTRRMRALGVNGTIDLRMSGGVTHLTGPVVRFSASVIGWKLTLAWVERLEKFQSLIE
jgi:hypothetical protein